MLVRNPATQVFLKSGLRTPADLSMARLLVVPELPLRRLIERRQQIESDVCRLKVARVGLRDVVAQTAERRLSRVGLRLLTTNESRRILPGDQPCGDRLRVALHSGDLPGKEHARVILELQCGLE